MYGDTILSAPLESIGSPRVWAITVGALLALVAVDFVITRRPHDVLMREALGWTVFYLALPVLFGLLIWAVYGGATSVEFFTGYVVEKSLSVDNLFVFMLLLAAFAVPPSLAQRVLLYGIVGALALRAVFIAAGAAVLSSGAWAFLLFGVVLLVTGGTLLRNALRGRARRVDVGGLLGVRLLRRLMPVTTEYHGARLTTRLAGRRTLTPMSLVVVAVFTTDIVFAVDSVPAVYGVTDDPYLVFATNAFALLGLRALYFVLHNALATVRHLNHGLAVILGFIGVKLVLHWAHTRWPGVPTVPTVLSLGAIAGTLGTVTVTSLLANRRDARRVPVGVGGGPVDRAGRAPMA